MFIKFYSKQIICLGTYFSIEIFSKNQCTNQLFLFHHYIEFLILYELVHRFYSKSSNVVFSIKNPGNLQNYETLQIPITK